ncbi:hypothetical protein LCGC14_0272990 [marine sediment metagenome]|uniref:Uncharacterized protein n=2 Tax=root TaxID=1 RepID=A0A9C9ND80_9HYPH|nr:hypothetical protein [Aurantimonas coralicida]
MSDLERRRAIRALMSAPQQFSDDELRRIVMTIDAEMIARVGEKVSYPKLEKAVANLCLGGGGRLTTAFVAIVDGPGGYHLTVSHLLAIEPGLLLAKGAGETTILATLVALLDLGRGTLPASWRAPPSFALARTWANAIALQRTDPMRLKEIAKKEKLWSCTNRLAWLIDGDHLSVT